MAEFTIVQTTTKQLADTGSSAKITITGGQSINDGIDAFRVASFPSGSNEKIAQDYFSTLVPTGETLTFEIHANNGRVL